MTEINFDKLIQVTKNLDAVTDEINRDLNELNKKLAEIRTGLVVWVTESGHDYGYYRFKDRGWQLAQREHKISGTEQPIQESARFHRYKCWTIRQQIVDALTATAESSTKKWLKSLGNQEMSEDNDSEQSKESEGS